MFIGLLVATLPLESSDLLTPYRVLEAGSMRVVFVSVEVELRHPERLSIHRAVRRAGKQFAECSRYDTR